MWWFFMVCVLCVLAGAVLVLVAFSVAHEAVQREHGVDEMVDRIDELQHISETQGLDAHPSNAAVIVEELAELATEYKHVAKFFGHRK